MIGSNTEIAKTSSGSSALPEALEHLQSELLTEDLATFLVAHYVLVTKNDSVSSVRDYFRSTPDIFECVDDILFQLETVGLVEISGDKISAKKHHIDVGNDSEVLLRFLPRLFKVSVDRVLKNAKAGTVRSNKEALRYFVLPNTPEVATEAKAVVDPFSTIHTEELEHGNNA